MREVKKHSSHQFVKIRTGEPYIHMCWSGVPLLFHVSDNTAGTTQTSISSIIIYYTGGELTHNRHSREKKKSNATRATTRAGLEKKNEKAVQE